MTSAVRVELILQVFTNPYEFVKFMILLIISLMNLFDILLMPCLANIYVSPPCSAFQKSTFHLHALPSNSDYSASFFFKERYISCFVIIDRSWFEELDLLICYLETFRKLSVFDESNII